MSSNYVDDDFDADSEEETPANLRRAANQAKKLRRELDSTRRELAFAKAGLPLEDPKMNYFIKGYDGDLDAQAIREAAMEAGFIQAQRQETVAQEQSQQQLAQQTLAGQERIIAASSGAIAEDVTEEAAIARMEAAMREGGIEALMDVARSYGMPTAYDG